jgi:hypothetical protein
MTMIATEALGHIEHATGLQGLASPLTGLGILNEAGEFLVSMHSWDWLVRPSEALNTVASQSYIELPSDLAAIVSIEATDGLNNSVRLTSLDEILALRTDTNAVAGWVRFAAVLWAEGSDGVPAPRLELWPTPGSADTGVYTVIYRRGWATLSDDGDTIRIPSWMHGVYLSIVRAIAAGYEEHDEASKQQRLAEIQLGPEFMAAKQRDCSMQIDYGPIEGGAAQRREWPVSSDWPWVGPTP